MVTLMEKSAELRQKIRETRPYIRPEGDAREGIRRTLEIVLDYIEFMVTPEDDDDREDSDRQWDA